MAVTLRPEIAALPPYRQGRPAAADAFKLSSNENPFPPAAGRARRDRRLERQPLPGRRRDGAARPARRALRRHARRGARRRRLGVDPRAADPGGRRPRRRGRLRLALVRGLPGARHGRRRDERAGAEPPPTDAPRPGRDGRGGHRPHPRHHGLQPQQPDGHDRHRARSSRRSWRRSPTRARAARRGVRRVRDRPAPPSTASRCSARYPNLVVLRTFSKAYGLAGLRVGYAVGPAYILDAARATAIPLSVTEPAQRAALAALDNEPELLERVAVLVERRDRRRARPRRRRDWRRIPARRATSSGCRPASRRPPRPRRSSATASSPGVRARRHPGVDRRGGVCGEAPTGGRRGCRDPPRDARKRRARVVRMSYTEATVQLLSPEGTLVENDVTAAVPAVDREARRRPAAATSTARWSSSGASTSRRPTCSGRGSSRSGSRASARRPRRSAPATPPGRRTTSSRPTASTSSARIRGLDPMEIIEMLRGLSHGGWVPAETGNFHLYTLVIGSQTLHATGYAMGIQFDGATATGDPETDAGRDRLLRRRRHRARATSARRSSSPRATRPRRCSSCRTTTGRSRCRSSASRARRSICARPGSASRACRSTATTCSRATPSRRRASTTPAPARARASSRR